VKVVRLDQWRRRDIRQVLEILLSDAERLKTLVILSVQEKPDALHCYIAGAHDPVQVVGLLDTMKLNYMLDVLGNSDSDEV
jgi:hypothetical protein